ncbi:MAG: aspartate/glutamate racemase family protein [Pseudomonadota bacterium]
MPKRKILMVLPVPLSAEALSEFSGHIPPELLRDDIEIDFRAASRGGRILDSYYETCLADAFVVEAAMKAEEEGYSAVCINSMSDSGLNALRSVLTIPVVGPGQASMLMASSLGNKFSVLTMWDRWEILYKKTIDELGISHRLASIRSIGVRPDAEELLSGKEEVVFSALLEKAKLAIEADRADVLILGSTTMHQSHEFLQSELPVPVINPGHAALKMCEVYMDMHLSHSKLAYRHPEHHDISVFDG